MADPLPSGAADGDVAARAHARAVTKAAGSSFYMGMRILPAARRNAMFAIYAFCRDVDDIADGNQPDAQKKADLEAWRDRIENLYSGDRPEDLTARALAPAIREYGLQKTDFLEVIDGMEMDTGEGMCAPSWDRLQLYCDRVAGAVGLLSIRVFGDASEDAQRFAIALGTALQLTNILRDLRDDARMGRLYLPAEQLAAAGIEARTPDAVLASPNLPHVCNAIAQIAMERYAEAAAALRVCNRRALRPAVVMMEIYRRTLERMTAAGWRETETNVSIPKLEKLWITLRFGIM